MDDPITAELNKATETAFRDVCNLAPTAGLDGRQSEAFFEARAVVDFWGPCHGRLIVSLFGDVMALVVQGMLGEEEKADARTKGDALKEITNIICGNVLPIIGGSPGPFHLGSPRIVPAGDPVTGNNPVPTAKVDVGLKNGRAEVSLVVIKGRCSAPIPKGNQKSGK
jgi:CheY-specific phosphatase CheX